METLPREIADEIVEDAIDKCSAGELIAFTAVNRKWGWRAQKRLYGTVDIRCMERAITFLTTLSGERAGLVFGKDNTHLLRYLVKKLQFSFDVRSYPSTTHATFKNRLAKTIPLAIFKDFTFQFSEVDPIAFDLMTGDEIQYRISSLRMISLEAEVGLVSPHLYSLVCQAKHQFISGNPSINKYSLVWPERWQMGSTNAVLCTRSFSGNLDVYTIHSGHGASHIPQWL
jgi:hypothetical protein